MSELLHQFGIDWRLLFLQAANFGLLLFLLYRFAYDPVLKLLQKRKDNIEEGIRASSEAKASLVEANTKRDHIIKEAKEESLNLIKDGENKAQDKYNEIIKKADKDKQLILAASEKQAESIKKASQDAFYKEAGSIIKNVVAGVVMASPDSIDDKLINKTIESLK